MRKAIAELLNDAYEKQQCSKPRIKARSLIRIVAPKANENLIRSLVCDENVGSQERQAYPGTDKTQIAMSCIPGSPKTGGRKKGTPNKCRKSIDYFAEQAFKKVDMVQKGIELLNHKDPRVQAMVWCRLMDYKFGRPREQLVISGSVDMRTIVAQARQRVLGVTGPPISLPGSNLDDKPLIAENVQIMDSDRSNDVAEALVESTA